MNLDHADPVTYDGLIINHQDERPHVNISTENTKLPYNCEEINKYFITRPLARQKADEIQYNIDRLEILGRGHYGIVYDIPDSQRVLKVIRQAFDITFSNKESSYLAVESSYDMFLKEFQIWTDIMNCKNSSDKIVKVYLLRTCWSVSIINSNRVITKKEVGIEAEKMECTLEKWLKQKVEKGEYNLFLVCKVIKRIVTIIRFLHEHHYLHNDIAIRNFLVDADGRIKISDFGLSRKLRTNNINGNPSESNDEHQDGYTNFIVNDHDIESSYSNYYLDKTQQDQPYWWCAPEVLKSLINRVDDLKYSKTITGYLNGQNSRETHDVSVSPIPFSYKTDNYMIGCFILELILSKNGKACRNGADFIPYSCDFSLGKFSPRDISLEKNLAVKMKQCYELKNQDFDLGKYEKFLRDDKFICFKEILCQLLEPRSENRLDDLSVIIDEIEKIQQIEIHT